VRARLLILRLAPTAQTGKRRAVQLPGLTSEDQKRSWVRWCFLYECLSEPESLCLPTERTQALQLGVATLAREKFERRPMKPRRETVTSPGNRDKREIASIRSLAESVGLQTASGATPGDWWLDQFLWGCVQFQYRVEIHHDMAIRAGLVAPGSKSPTWFDQEHGFPSAKILHDVLDPILLYWVPKLGQFNWLAPWERERSHELLDQAWDEHEKDMVDAGLSVFRLTGTPKHIHWARLTVMEGMSPTEIAAHAGDACTFAVPHPGEGLDVSAVTRSLRRLFANELTDLRRPPQRRSLRDQH